MANVIEARAIISATDKTGAAFSSVERRANELDRAMARVTRSMSASMKAQQAAERSFADASGYDTRVRAVQSLARHTERLAAASRDAEKAMVGHGKAQRALLAAKEAGATGFNMLGLGGLGAAAAGLTAVDAAKFYYRTRAANLHERVRMSTGGMSDHEIAEASKHAQTLSTEHTPFDSTTVMHMLRNARSVVGSYEEAAHIMDPMLKLRTVALGANPHNAAALSEDFDKLIKGMEIKGVTQDLPKFTKYMDGMAKAINVFGDTLRPTDYYEMFKYGRQATTNLSESYMNKVAPTLAQELGGASAGTAQAAFFRAIVGGKMSNLATNELNRIGLLDPSKITKTKTGNVKGVAPGGIKGSALAAENPYEWVQRYLLPALTSHGVTDPHDVQERIARVFSSQVAAQLVGLFATQQSRIEKDAKLVEHAEGLEAAKKIRERDPLVAWESVKAQAQTLVNAYNGMEHAASALNKVAEYFAGWTKAKQAQDEGKPSTGLSPENLDKLNRYNLKGKPAAGTTRRALAFLGDPDAAAEEADRKLREEAAERKGKLYFDIGKIERDQKDLPPIAAQKRAPYVASKIAEIRAQIAEINEGLKAMDDARAGLAEAQAKARDFDSRRFNQPAGPDGKSYDYNRPRFGFGPGGITGDNENVGEGGRTVENAPLPPARPGSLPQAAPPAASLKDILGGGQVTATLTGSAQVTGETTVKVEVMPSGQLLQVIAQAQAKAAMSGTLQPGGSTSMPQYASPPPAAAPSIKAGPR